MEGETTMGAKYLPGDHEHPLDGPHPTD